MFSQRQIRRNTTANFDVKKKKSYNVLQCTLCVRACLHGGGGPQVGEVTRLAAFTCNLITPGCWVEVS